MYSRRSLQLFSMSFAALCGLSAHAAINVGPGGDYATIQPAINFAVGHPGSNEIRVHTGVYNESLNITTAMNSGTIVLSGGWADNYLAQVPDAAANTIVSPDPGQRAVEFAPLGGSVTVSDFNFYGTTTTAVYLSAANTATITAERLLVTDVAFESSNAPAECGGLCVTATGSSIVTVRDSIFERDRVTVLSGTGSALGAGAGLVCSNGAECDLLNNVFRNLTIEARNAGASGGAIYVRLSDTAKSYLDANLIEQIHDGTMQTFLSGRSVYIQAHGDATVRARRNRVLGNTAPVGPVTLAEIGIDLYEQAVVTLSDSLVAQSPLTALRVDANGSASARLNNLTIADNARGIFVFSMSTSSQYLSNSLITNAPSDNFFQGTTFSADRFGTAAPFLAPTLADYSLRRADAQFADAGNDAPVGLLGVRDITGGPRLLGSHVDIGAWESSDRIFADRFDP